jgi:hypothetical protein
VIAEAEETVVSVTVQQGELPPDVYEIQYSTEMKWMFENGPTVPVVTERLVGVVDERMFVVLSQFLNRNVQEVRLLVPQLQTVIQTFPTGPPEIEFTAVVMLKVHVPESIVALPKSVL